MRSHEKYSDKALRPILQDIANSCENENANIFDGDYVDRNFDEIVGIVDGEIETYIGTPTFEETTYFIALLLMNKNFMTEPIKRPQLKSYKVLHVYEKVSTIQTTYENTYDSFIPLTNSKLADLQSRGEYQPDEGEEVDQDEVDSEWTNDWVSDIEEI